jgi:hypothetical protein
MNPDAYVAGISLLTRDMYSAMPDAPVVPHRAGNPRVRRVAARALRRMADRMDLLT